MQTLANSSTVFDAIVFSSYSVTVARLQLEPRLPVSHCELRPLFFTSRPTHAKNLLRADTKLITMDQ